MKIDPSVELESNRSPAMGRSIFYVGVTLALLCAVAAATSSLPGLQPKTAWFIASVGIGVAAYGHFLRAGSPRYGLLASSLIIGGAAQLWLTLPLWFPVIRLRIATPADALMALLVLAQGGLAVATLWRDQAFGKLAGVLRHAGAIRAFLFLVLSALVTVSPLGYLPHGEASSYVVHLFAAGAVIAVNLLTVTAMSMQGPPEYPARRFQPILLAGIVLVASSSLGLFAFQGIPHVQDEVAYVFQARTLASGHVSVPAPPEALQPGLEYYLFDIEGGRWFATTPPMWPAVLALGVIAGMPWLVNPLLAAASVLLTHRLVRLTTDKDKADVAALLMVGSPWLIGTAASLMPHVAALFFTLVSWNLLLVKAQGRRSALLALAAGLAMGAMFATRQLEGVIIGGVTGLVLLYAFIRSKAALDFARGLAFAAGAIVTGSIYLIHNAVLTGNPFYTPLARYLTKLWGSASSNAYGFGANVGPSGGWGRLDPEPGHSALEGLYNTLQNLSGIQLELFGWGVGSLALIFVLILWGRFKTWDWLAAALVVLMGTALFFYWFSGSFYIGPRYWFGVFVPLVYLSASGFVALRNRIAGAGAAPDAAESTLLLLVVFSLVVFTPWRGVEKYKGFGGFNDEFRQHYAEGSFGNAIVFFNVDADPGSALFLNDPTFPEDKPIFVRDLGPEQNAKVMAQFPDRPVIHFTDENLRR